MKRESNSTFELALEDADGRRVRTFWTHSERIRLLKNKQSQRLILLDANQTDSAQADQRFSQREFEKNHLALAELDIQEIQKSPFSIGEIGKLHFISDSSSQNSGQALQTHASVAQDVSLGAVNPKTFRYSLGACLAWGALMLFAAFNSKWGSQKLDQELQQQVVQIIQKLPPKKTQLDEKQASNQSQNKALAQKAPSRLGALGVLGSLSKSAQKGGLNLGAAQTSAGPGLGGNAGSGGVQTNIYARGLVAAPLGAGGNLQGAGGYGTKGRGGGQAGYGSLSIVGAKGSSSIPLTSEASVGGGLDRDLIGSVISKNLGQIRFCYEQGLQGDSALSGRVAVEFTIDPQGGVKTAAVQASSLNSKLVEDCVLLRLKTWKFPLPEGGREVKVVYPFMLRRTGQG